ncbi:MAG: OB-fold nucleic acid binding domain-containing protein, partial [Fervidobacterium pennivorans]
MEWVYIKNLKDYIDKEVELRGWVRRKRSSGKIMFIEFRDGTGFVQVVVEKTTVGDENFEKADKLRLESSLIVRG